MMAAYSRIRVCGKRFNKTLRRIRNEGTAPSTKELGYFREFRGSEWSLMDMCAAENDIPTIGLLIEAGANVEISKCKNAETMRFLIESVQTPENATIVLCQVREMMSKGRELTIEMIELMTTMAERFGEDDAVRIEHVLFNIQLDPAAAQNVDNAALANRVLEEEIKIGKREIVQMALLFVERFGMKAMRRTITSIVCTFLETNMQPYSLFPSPKKMVNDGEMQLLHRLYHDGHFKRSNPHLEALLESATSMGMLPVIELATTDRR